MAILLDTETDSWTDRERDEMRAQLAGWGSDDAR